MTRWVRVHQCASERQYLYSMVEYLIPNLTYSPCTYCLLFSQYMRRSAIKEGALEEPTTTHLLAAAIVSIAMEFLCRIVIAQMVRVSF